MFPSLSPDLATVLLFTFLVLTFFFVSHIFCKNRGLDTDMASSARFVQYARRHIISSCLQCPKVMFAQRYYIMSKSPLFSGNKIRLAVRLTESTGAGFRGGSTDTWAGNLEQMREDSWFLGVKILGLWGPRLRPWCTEDFFFHLFKGAENKELQLD